MTRPLRIGYFVPGFPGPGDYRFRCEIAALEAEGHVVRPVSTRPPGTSRPEEDWIQDLAARTRYLDRFDPAAMRALFELVPRGLYLSMLTQGPRFARDTMLSLSATGQLFRYAEEEALDHVHAPSNGDTALVAALCRRMGGPPFSLALRSPLAAAGPGQRFIWREADFAFAATARLEAEAIETLGDSRPARLRVQPPGIDADFFSRAAPYEPVRHGRPMRLFANARLAPEAGQLDLLSAMRQLLDLGVDVRLEIAGEDDAGGSGFRTRLQSHLKQLHLRDHVKLPGALGIEAVRDRLRAADAFVQASWNDPVAEGCIEAMSTGVPVVACHAGGVPEIVRDGHTGILVPPRNPGALARALRDFAGNPDYARQLSETAREEVEARFLARHGAEALVHEIARSD